MTTPSQRLSIEDVARFYDQMGQFFAIVWGENLHAGYWKDASDPASIVAAQEWLSDLMIGKLAMKPGQRLLDVGCGIGAPAFRLAQRTNCEIVGITISRSQVQQANQRAQAALLADRVRFLFADALHLPFADRSFDAVWAFESLFHMLDRQQALREMARVLRPGGRLVLADTFERRPIQTAERELFFPAYAINSVIPFDEYRNLVQTSGFDVDEMHNITEHTHRIGKLTFQALFDRAAALQQVYGTEFVRMIQQSWPITHGIYEDAMGYLIGVAHKPHT